MPGASMLAMRNGLRSVGARSNVIACTDPRSTSAPVVLTANTETTYGTTFLDLQGGRPDGGRGAAELVVVRRRPVAAVRRRHGQRRPGPRAGRQVPVPATRTTGRAPDGYFVFRSPTYSNWIVIRALDGLESLMTTRIYPLAAADNPPETGFVDIAASSFNGIHANDFTFFEEVNTIVQEEPAGALDPERAGQLAAIGIVNGQPFEPDEHHREILDQAAQDRRRAGPHPALQAARPRAPTIYDDGSWKTAFVGGSYEFLAETAPGCSTSGR